jgi:hypothetical protein
MRNGFSSKPQTAGHEHVHVNAHLDVHLIVDVVGFLRRAKPASPN